MDAGKIYDAVVGGVMALGGVMFVCIDFGLLPRSGKMREAGEKMPLKKEHPLLFSLIGPIAFILGIIQILRQFRFL